MSKTTIVRLFWGSLVAFVAASIFLIAAGSLLYLNGDFIMRGPDVVGIEPDSFGWSMIAAAAFAALVAFAAAIVQLVAWIGALLNTVELEDKAWFVVLLITGVLGIGFVAMLAYAIAGPDGARTEARPREDAQGTPERQMVVR
jgi:hypothetical protein